MNESCHCLETMNIELTTNCPLHCPQCYCSLTGGKNIDPEKAVYWIREGSGMGVKEVMLSGGETLCYPHLYDVIRAARQYCGGVNVALSGFGFTQEVYEKLIEAGVTGIFISLNGSTEEINALSRDGYGLALAALELLQKNRYANTTINWVMHSSNGDDFARMVELAEKYEAASLVVMGVKPDSHKNLSTVPSREQMEKVKNIIQTHKGKTHLYVETCFSPMLALVCDTRLFGNMNVGKRKGCSAGRTTFSVSVDGLLSPCRHLEYYESFSTLKEYVENSEILKKIRHLEEERREPCSSCRFMEYCRHCLAVNAKIHHELYIGNEYCPIYEKRENLS